MLSWKLKTKISLFIIFATILPLSVGALYLLWSFTRISAETGEKELAHTTVLVEQMALRNVQSKAQVYDLVFKDLILDLEGIRATPSQEGIEQFLKNYYYQHSFIARAYFIETTGALTAMSAVGVEKGMLLVPTLNIQRFASENTSTGLWVGPYAGEAEQPRVFTYFLPLYEEDKFVGAAAFDVTADTLLKSIVQLDLASSSYTFILRNDGRIVSSSDKKILSDFQIDAANDTNISQSKIMSEASMKSQLSKKEGFFILPAQDKKDQKIVIFSSIPSFESRVFIVSPLSEIVQIQKEKADEIQGTISRIGLWSFVSIVLLAVFLSLISFYFAQKVIIGPLVRLRSGIEGLKNTHFNTQIPVSGHDEIGELSNDFNRMAKELKSSYDSLEQKVMERTQELRNKIGEIEQLNEHMINRELKMIELKKKIKDVPVCRVEEDQEPTS